MKIKLFVILSLFTLLFSCSSSNDEATVTWLVDYENTDFSMSLPSNWENLTWTSSILPKPKSLEISLAVSSNELKYGFSNNLLVLKQDLLKSTTSLDFSILNNVWSTKEYLEYTKIESKSIDFADSDKSNLYVFEAKYNTTTPKLKFLQVWKVCSSKKWFLLTIALSTDIKDTSKYEEVLKTFKCK